MFLLIRIIGIKNTLYFLYKRINFFLNSESRQHIYEDLECSLPPTEEFWEKSIAAIKKQNKYVDIEFRKILGPVFILVIRKRE